MSIICVNNIKKIYNENTSSAVCALSEVSLCVERGEMVAIVGASGSGKSTLMHILACLDVNFEGEYLFDNENIKKINNAELADIRNRKIGIILQNYGLIYDMSVYDNVTLPAMIAGGRLWNSGMKERAGDVLADLGMADKIYTPAGKLSGGQKQRVAIARALINNPILLLADEPTGALDYRTSMEIMKIFINLNRQGKTIIIVTHDMKIASMCPRNIEISDGKLL